MGSGVLLAALVVLWFVVLVPMVVTRGDARPAGAGVADAGRTLRRRRAVDPAVHAETERVAIDRDALRSTGELTVDVHKLRRRTLLGLVALAVATFVGAMALGGWLWGPQALFDLAAVGYVLVLRKAARRERLAARRAARAAEREALRARTAARPERAAPRPAAAVDDRLHETVAPEEPAGPAQPSVPLAPVRTLRPGRVVAARTPTPAGWQHSAVVGLDDDDIGFADIDVYQPRVVNG
jgi:hypothetical protein